MRWPRPPASRARPSLRSIASPVSSCQRPARCRPPRPTPARSRPRWWLSPEASGRRRSRRWRARSSSPHQSTTSTRRCSPCPATSFPTTCRASATRTTWCTASPRAELSFNGFGAGGGSGRSLAELITTGEAELDLHPYRPWRFGPVHRDHRYVAELAREAYRDYYYLRYPYDSDELGRPRRASALHERLQDWGAVFGVKHGWERADYFQPGRPWRRAGADQRSFGWTKPPYFDVLAEEHRAFRERVGIIDMTSFGKIDVRGPGALALLERVAGNLIDRPSGSVVYTQLLADNGGIAADVTVTRLAEEHFRVVTGAGYVNSDLGWLHMQLRDGDAPVELR